MYSKSRVFDAVEKVERARDQNLYSKQHRFDPDKAFDSFFSLYKHYMLKKELNSYKPDNRLRDEWLSDFWKMEPHLAGVVNSVVAIDKNRNWTISGPQRQVTLYSNILKHAEDGLGWRDFCSIASESFYTADMNTIVEVGRDSERGPLRAIYNVDPVKCLLTGDRDYPLRFFPEGKGDYQEWTSYDYFRISSLPSKIDKFNRLGFCAVSRCIELVCLLMAVYEYDQEQLGSRAPTGLLLLQNIAETQWENAMSSRDEALNDKERKYFGGVMVLAQEGMDQIDAKLVALSELPRDFDRETATNQIMYGISLCFGYSPDEFYPVQYGALGRSRETEIHHMRATAKGGSDFVLGYQEKFQRELPSSVLFEFDKRDAETDLVEARVHAEWATVADTLYNKGEGVLDREEARSLLASKGIIDPAWSAIDEGYQSNAEGTSNSLSRTQLNVMREEMLEKEQIVRSIELFPNQPIVRYNYRDNKFIRLWDRGSDALKRRSWEGVDVAENQE